MTADDDSAAWPLPKFCFEADLGNGLINAIFQEVAGMDVEPPVIEYRKANSAVSATFRMPDIKRSGNVILKKGVLVCDNSFWDWYNQVKMNTIQRGTVLIRLLDASGAPTMQWQLQHAWPTKITGMDLLSEENKVAVETMEIAHEGIIINNGQ